MATRTSGLLLATLLTALVGYGAGDSLAADAVTRRSYALPNHGSLTLLVPRDWKDSVQQPPRELPPTVQFSPPSGDDFVVLITALWSPQARPGFNAPDMLRQLAEKNGRALLPSAVEQTLIVEEILGPETIGYVYTLTDKAPKPGEYEYLTQATVGVGQLALTCTVLHRSKNAPARALALEMLKSARHL